MPRFVAINSHETFRLQITGRTLENGEPIVRSGSARLPASSPNPLRSLSDQTSIGVAVPTHTTLAPITSPAVHCGTCGAIQVPQRQYRSAPLSPDPTYEHGEVILFSKGGGCGVPVNDAAEYRLSDLFGGDDIIFADTAVTTFSVRIEVRTFAVRAITRS